MTPTDCVNTLMGICLVTANKGESGSIFGIADFLATVAIFVAAFSFSDARYKFRTAASWLPFTKILFLATFVGGLSLAAATLWFDRGLPIPRFLNNLALLQLGLGTILLVLLSLWMYSSFVRPMKFSRWNAIPFSRAVFRSISGGSDEEINAAAYEVGRSAEQIVKIASEWETQHNLMKGGIERTRTASASVGLSVLSLIGDRRFCRVVARNHPWVAQEIFYFASDSEFPAGAIAQFSRNVANELFLDENSAIHHEDEGYSTGLIGDLKPINSAIFGNSRLVNRLAIAGGSPLDLLWLQSGLWGIQSWNTYNKAILIYLRDDLKRNKRFQLSAAVKGIFYQYEHAYGDLREVNEMSERDYFGSLPYQKFAAAVTLVGDMISMLEEFDVKAERRTMEGWHRSYGDEILDLLAKTAFQLIVNAGSVNTNEWRSWEVQHNTLWTAIMSERDDTAAHKMFRARLQRLIWKEVSEMQRLPNYVGARALLVCMNAMGFRMDRVVDKQPAIRGVKRLILCWVRNNFLALHAAYPDVARACIGGTISFDEENRRLVKTYRGTLGREPAREYLELEPVGTA